MQETNIGGKNIFVVRDDLLAGGTKQRGLADLLQHYKRQGHRQFAYASPFCGYAQIALSYLCQQFDLECVLFCERDKTSPQSHAHAHPYTLKARKFGAKILLYNSLAEAQVALNEGCRGDQSLFQIPLGFDCPEFIRYYTEALNIQWDLLLRQLGQPPKVLWLPVGSGTLTQSFLKVINTNQIKIHAVNVHVLKADDQRMTRLSDSPHVNLFSAPQSFHVPEETRPPFPSNVFYDAKLGPFISKYANDGDVWWNVAN